MRPSLGASPRMRGTDEDPAVDDHRRRCIPAHAGNGACQAGAFASPSVHPRACGERVLNGASPVNYDGASPRMRGTARSPVPRCARRRCIPAHAGNGAAVCATVSPRAVHPRACGERALQARDLLFGGGASPRMRGTGVPQRGAAPARRCIPAHAGNGRWPARRPWARPVHPRACGERDGAAELVGAPSGASPRMRGTGDGDGLHPQPGGCIPAHAGNGS